MVSKKLVEVFRNIDLNRFWTVKEVKSKKIVSITPRVFLKDVSFVINEEGRQRMIREQKMNVHAVAQGYLDTSSVEDIWVELKYNPYVNKNFIRLDTNEEVLKVRRLKIDNKKFYAAF
jgi:hypothetical protein